MKRTILSVGLTAALLLSVRSAVQASDYSIPNTRVRVVRITPGAAPLKVLAFQNTSTGEDIIIRKIEIVNSSTQAVTGGIMQFLVYTSTRITHSAAVTTGDYSYSAAPSVTQPASLTVSTAPIAVLVEGNTAADTEASIASMTGYPPILRPFVVNSDEAATTNLVDSWSEESPTLASPLVLPANSQRGIIIEKRQLGATDYAVGGITFRIVYTTR